MKIILIIIVALAVLIVGSSFWMAISSRGNSPALGVQDGQFVPCPDSPNCVSSDAEGPEHGFPALDLTTKAEWTAIVAQVQAMPGVTVTEQAPGYLRAEARTPLFGYVDDVELHQRDRQLALRSASRVGHSDLGANRKRLEALRGRLQAEGLVE